MLSTLAKMILCVILLTALLSAQEPPGKRIPSVTMSTPAITKVTRGKSNIVELRFHVSSGFHINSNKPSAEYLIPTALKLDAPTDIVLGRITYPEGQEMSFAFAPNEKLSVYSGEFDLEATVRPLASVLPGDYEFHGQLKYQACDNAACYPPKQLPVRFVVKVVKAPVAPQKNPAQSPHIHN
jgi:hypothetical protein